MFGPFRIAHLFVQGESHRVAIDPHEAFALEQPAQPASATFKLPSRGFFSDLACMSFRHEML